MKLKQITQNKYVKRWKSDLDFRLNISLFSSLFWNTAYAVFQSVLGFYHRSFWYLSLATYYLCLAVMRFFLIKYTQKHKAGESVDKELIRYRACGWIFLLMNLALTLMIFFMVYWDRTFYHHEITTIAMAAYTFTTLTFAIINAVKYRNLESPIYTASKAISLAAACVSLLTLEATMLTTFSDGTVDIFTRRIMLGSSGGAISLFIIAMAVYMIVTGKRRK